MPHQVDDQRCDGFGQCVCVDRVVGDVDLANAGDLRCRLRDRVDAMPSDQQVNVAQLRCGGDCAQRRVLDAACIIFDPDQRLHATIPMSFIFDTSASTSATLMPAVRFGGSTTFSVVSRRVTSTP